jgi:hypothetical protein
MTASPAEISSLTRAERQREVFEWCGRTFGLESQRDRKKRALRFLEEAIELYQAEGCNLEQAQALVAHVFAKPAGEPQQEVGGVSVTLLSYCEAAGLSAERWEPGPAGAAHNANNSLNHPTGLFVKQVGWSETVRNGGTRGSQVTQVGGARELWRESLPA